MYIEVSPEPVPNFTIARMEWGAAWPIHYNLYGIMFSLMMLYCINSIYALLSVKINFQRRKIFIIVNVMLSYFSFVSSLSLLIDPYDSGEHIKTIKFRGLLFVIFGLRVPCLTASFCLIQLSFLESVKLQLYSNRLQSFRLITVVVLIHFLIFLISDIALLVVRMPRVFLVICQGFTICLGVTIFLLSGYSGVRIIRHYNLNKLSISKSRIGFEDGQKEGKGTVSIRLRNIKVRDKFKNTLNSISFKDKSIRKIAILSILMSILGLGYCCCFVFSIANVFMSMNTMPDPWLWYILQTLFRFFEVGLIAIMSYIVRRNVLFCKC